MIWKSMHRLRSSAVLFVLFAAMTASAAQVPSTALCDAMVAQIQSSPQEEPWSLLTKGARPFIELAGESEMKALGFADAVNDADLVNRFTAKFNPSDALRKAWADRLDDGNVDIAALPGSDLHVVTISGGTALCYDFMFFQTPSGRQAQLLPELPNKSDRDGENLICNKYGGDGYLARVGRIEAFLETFTSENKFYYRVVPLRDGRWGNACVVEAEYGTKYQTSKAFVPSKGPLTEADLESVAPQIVEKREAVKDAKDFSFGSPLSEREKEDVRAMTDLVAKMEREPFPAFGREKELSAGEETLRSGDSFPLVLNGAAYLLRLGEGQLGCCFFPGPLLIFYTLKDGKIEPVGSAIVEKSRGSLKSLRATPSR